MTKRCLYQASQDQIDATQMTAFRQYLNESFDQSLKTEADLYQFSVQQVALFWQAFQKFAGIQWIHEPKTAALSDIVDDIHKMPGAIWFKGARLNYAQNLLLGKPNDIAIYDVKEDLTCKQLSYRQLNQGVAKLQEVFKGFGVIKSTHISAIMPNSSEAVQALLATASLGAIWSSCSPEMGLDSLLSRLEQVKPKLLIMAQSYTYKGKHYDISDKLVQILKAVPSVENVIVVGAKDLAKIQSQVKQPLVAYETVLEKTNSHIDTLHFEAMQFQDPAFILFSSGSTGKPKCMVHSVGGVLIQHLKEHRLHCDIKANSNVFYYSTCSWMMFNWLVGALACGSAITLYEGAPFYPNAERLFDVIDQVGITHFGVSAKYLQACQKENLKPKQTHQLASLQMILSTGSPLAASQFNYVYENILNEAYLASISGGSDIVSCFVLGNPNLPVYEGYIQCRGLGMDVACFKEDGTAVMNQEGELVCRQAFPSMPLYFLNDPDQEKFNAAYFEQYPGLWHHGDYMLIDEEGYVKILGRSDSTLNPGGIRLGTGEIYAALEALPIIQDAIVVSKKIELESGSDEEILLCIQVAGNSTLNEPVKAPEDLKQLICKTLKNSCSIWHIPKFVFCVHQIPYTHNGKKLEKSVKKIIQTQSLTSIDLSAIANPDSLKAYLAISKLI